MAILLDTGVLYAYYDRRDQWHLASRKLFESEVGEIIIPAPILPEVDYLLGERLGSGAQALLYEGLVDESFLVVDLPQESYARVLELNLKYPALRLGFVDAAVLAMAEHLKLGRIATTDRRHFSPVRLSVPLELLPEG
ncbi:MAG TPA: PIN domain-containing protein [Thermoanaerobaculia bacterium]|nr:PIN domain-containing protein [Thermoanaerobaculia bacterium]